MKKRQKRLKQILSSIHIALDDYDDIFSDFDISSYENRALSQDFLDELKARCDGKKLKDKIKLILSLPKKERNKKDEKVIIARIKRYFDERTNEIKQEIHKMQMKGIKFVLIGIFFLILALYVPELHINERLADIIGDVIATPLGWFFTWTGLSMMIEEPSEYKEELEFFQKLKNASLIFIDEEQILENMNE
jgi:hypothetical protein